MSDLADGLPKEEAEMKGQVLKLIDPDLSNTHDNYTVFLLAWVDIKRKTERIEELEQERDAANALLSDECYIRELVDLWDRQASLGEQG